MRSSAWLRLASRLASLFPSKRTRLQLSHKVANRARQELWLASRSVVSSAKGLAALSACCCSLLNQSNIKANPTIKPSSRLVSSKCHPVTLWQLSTQDAAPAAAGTPRPLASQHRSRLPATATEPPLARCPQHPSPATAAAAAALASIQPGRTRCAAQRSSTTSRRELRRQQLRTSSGVACRHP